MKAFFFAVLMGAATLLGLAPSVAQDRNAMILTVDGAIAGGKARDFSIAELEALGTAQIKTGTPWYDGKVTFEGVSLAKLMEFVGASGTNVSVMALNNYSSELPLSDFVHYGVILALKKDGAYMSVAEKGPLFIIYPFDKHSELNSELYYSRSVWQIRRITVE